MCRELLENRCVVLLSFQPYSFFFFSMFTLVPGRKRAGSPAGISLSCCRETCQAQPSVFLYLTTFTSDCGSLATD